MRFPKFRDTFHIGGNADRAASDRGLEVQEIERHVQRETARDAAAESQAERAARRQAMLKATGQRTLVDQFNHLALEAGTPARSELVRFNKHGITVFRKR